MLREFISGWHEPANTNKTKNTDNSYSANHFTNCQKFSKKGKLNPPATTGVSGDPYSSKNYSQG